MQQRLNISIGLDTPEVPFWIYRLIEKVQNEKTVTIESIILTQQKHRKNRIGWIRQFHMALDKKHFKPSPDAFELKSVETLLGKASMIPVDSIRQQQAPIDLVIWLSWSEVPSAIYSWSKQGVWSYLHGDGQDVDEQLLGYEEFVQMKGIIKSVLQQKKSALEKGTILYESWSMMPSISMSRGRNEHFWKILSFVPRALNRLMTKQPISNDSVTEAPLPQSSQLSTALPTSSFSALINLSLHGGRMLHKIWRKLNFREQWILLLLMGQSPSRSFKDFQPLYPPKDCFWADPFLLNRDGQCYLFFEELPFATDKGHISVVKIDSSGQPSEPQRVLETPYHLSYPFLLEYEDSLYMIPESYQANCIQVFECIEFPLKWVPKLKLMDEVCAMDTTLFYYRDKWWMFTAITENPGASHHDELFIFFADEPLTDQWTAHPQNPVVSDVRRARPAGNIYIEDGVMIRPSQDSTRKYGFGFNLNKIEVLSETEYRESPILKVRPDWNKEIRRTHSYVHQPGITVIDGLIQRKK